MEKFLRFRLTVVFLVLMFLMFFTVLGDEREREYKGQRSEVKKSTVVYLSRIVAGSRGYGERLKTMMSRAHAYLFPPNLDFRGEDKTGSNIGGGGTGEKVKEAAARSFEKSKETVQDTARSAAEAAGEAVDKTKKKVKETLSGQPQGEL